MTQINLFDYRRHIEVHGRPTPAVFRKKGIQGGKNSHQLVWTVDSYTPIQEYRLLYRQIKPYHPVRIEPPMLSIPIRSNSANKTFKSFKMHNFALLTCLVAFKVKVKMVSISVVLHVAY